MELALFSHTCLSDRHFNWVGGWALSDDIVACHNNLIASELLQFYKEVINNLALKVFVQHAYKAHNLFNVGTKKLPRVLFPEFGHKLLTCQLKLCERVTADRLEGALGLEGVQERWMESESIKFQVQQ